MTSTSNTDAKSQKVKSSKSHIKSVRFDEAERIRESTKSTDEDSGYSRFRVCLIQEGLGNFHDAFFYTKDALKSISMEKTFEGKKIYADHPTPTESGERTVRNIIGHYENIAYKESNSGQGEVHADAVLLKDSKFSWARSLLTRAVEYAKKYPNQSFIGLSINAFGNAVDTPIDEVVSTSQPVLEKLLKAKEKGIQTVRVVNHIEEAISCDVVTEAGAGGKILNFLEGAKKMADEKTTDTHDDAAQDKKLILDMIKKHMTDKPSESPESEEEEALKLHASAKEVGCNEEEAAMYAGKHMMIKKKETEGKKEGAKKETEEEAEKKESHKKEDESEEKKKEAKKETEEECNKGKKESEALVAAKGKIAMLESELKQIKFEKDMGAYIDKKLKESGYKTEVTKAVRPLLEGLKNQKDIDSTLKIFFEGCKTVVTETKEDVSEGFNFSEKNTTVTDSKTESAGFDFSGLV